MPGPLEANGARSVDGLFIRHGDRRVRLKWHKLRRQAGDPPFDRGNLAAGLAAGASMEVDIQVLSDGGFVCLHDHFLEPETTGTGPVAASDSETIRTLRQLDSHGNATGPAPLLLEELTELIGAGADTAAKGAQVQLDLKDAVDSITDVAVEMFARQVGAVAGLLSLSGEDWQAVKRLGGEVPGLSLGYDPSVWVVDEELRVGGLSRLLDHIAETAPEAETIYPHHSILAAARDRGIDLVGALQREGRLVDCWTIGTNKPDTQAQLRLAVEAGVDQITTDTPGDLERLWATMAGQMG